MNSTGQVGSVAFDHAVGYYDETRGLSPEASLATTDLLAAEFRGSGRLLEVGVGTGLLALPLVERGFPVVGIDLSVPMIARSREKAGAAASLGLAVADATRLPFRSGSFDGAFMRHVLHLVPSWRVALEEVVRVVRPGGRFLVSITDYSGLYREVQHRFLAEAGGLPLAIGLRPDDDASLRRAMSTLGARARRLPPVRGRRTLTMRRFLEHVEEGYYTWTWAATHRQRIDAVGRLRSWLVRRFENLDRPVESEYSVEWWAFELPRRRPGPGQAGA